VFGVTVRTFGLTDVGYATVKSLCGPDVFRDLLVTGGTEISLPGLPERFVTFAARILELGVTLDDRAGHDQPFQTLCNRGGGRKHHESPDHDRGEPPRTDPS